MKITSRLNILEFVSLQLKSLCGCAYVEVMEGLYLPVAVDPSTPPKSRRCDHVGSTAAVVGLLALTFLDASMK